MDELKIEKKYLTLEEAANYLRIKPKTLYNLRCKGARLGHRIGGTGHLLFLQEELDLYIRGPIKKSS